MAAANNILIAFLPRYLSEEIVKRGGLEDLAVGKSRDPLSRRKPGSTYPPLRIFE
jgi:hypothetical protein